MSTVAARTQWPPDQGGNPYTARSSPLLHYVKKGIALLAEGHPIGILVEKTFFVVVPRLPRVLILKGSNCLKKMRTRRGS